MLNFDEKLYDVCSFEDHPFSHETSQCFDVFPLKHREDMIRKKNG